MRRRVLSVLVIISVLSFLIQDDYAQGKERGREVLDSQEAEKIAECFMVESNGRIEEDLKKDVSPMYDSQEDISAYMVTFNNDHKQQGYAVVNAKESRGTVIEYCYGENNFVEEATDKLCKSKEEKKKSKVYYLGGLTYVLKTKHPQKGDKYTDISTGESQPESDPNFIESSQYYGSAKDSEGKIITRPKDYVSGKILSSQTYDVPGSVKYSNQGNRVFKTYYEMGDFSEGEVCTPTAITNLYYHWSRYNPGRFSKLKNGTWPNTFNRMLLLCDTSKTQGTNIYNVADAIEWYCTSRDVKCKARTYHGTNGGTKIVSELKNRRPCILHVQKHYTYGNHAMLALGYETYRY